MRAQVLHNFVFYPIINVRHSRNRKKTGGKSLLGSLAISDTTIQMVIYAPNTN